MTIPSIPDDHLSPEDSQVIIVLTGEPLRIREKLKEIADQIVDKNYSKPVQGTSISYKIKSTIYTPMWGGKKY